MNTFLEPLSTKEELIYLQKMKNGDNKARDVLIQRNMRLVAHIVKKYNIKESDVEDVISIGTIGLIKAIDTFKPSKKIRLATYASRCIENEILMMFRNDKKSAKEIYMYEAVSLDNVGNVMSLIDIIESKDEDIAERMYIKESIQQMYCYMEQVLSDREKEILQLRYGLYKTVQMTQREIAIKLGISRSYVSRIEKRALIKLRECYEKYL